MAEDPLVVLRDAEVRIAGRSLWGGLTLDVSAGEFLAVLGPNGAGKTTLLRVLLGLLRLDRGLVLLGGHAPRRGDPGVGWVPQRAPVDVDLPLRGRDLVRLGVDGHRFGPPRRDPRAAARVQGALEAVGAASYADAPVGRLSGGEQQRLRVAQALVGEPRLLLCDEPLANLDEEHQHEVAALVDAARRTTGATVVFVTHDLDPVLPFADRLLHLSADGRYRLESRER